MKEILTRSLSHVSFVRAECKSGLKAAESIPPATNVLYLILLQNNGNVGKKFQPYIIYRSQENCV